MEVWSLNWNTRASERSFAMFFQYCVLTFSSNIDALLDFSLLCDWIWCFSCNIHSLLIIFPIPSRLLAGVYCWLWLWLPSLPGLSDLASIKLPSCRPATGATTLILSKRYLMKLAVSMPGTLRISVSSISLKACRKKSNDGGSMPTKKKRRTKKRRKITCMESLTSSRWTNFSRCGIAANHGWIWVKQHWDNPWT